MMVLVVRCGEVWCGEVWCGVTHIVQEILLEPPGGRRGRSELLRLVVAPTGGV